MPLSYVAYFTGKNSIKGLIVIHFIFLRVNRTSWTGLCYVLYRVLKYYVEFTMIKTPKKNRFVLRFLLLSVFGRTWGITVINDTPLPPLANT